MEQHQIFLLRTFLWGIGARYFWQSFYSKKLPTFNSNFHTSITIVAIIYFNLDHKKGILKENVKKMYVFI